MPVPCTAWPSSLDGCLTAAWSYSSLTILRRAFRTFGWPDLPTWHHCSGPKSYNDKYELGSCIYEHGHILTLGTRLGPGLYLEYNKLFEAIFFQNWWQRRCKLVSRTLCWNLQRIFFHAPDMTICESMHDCSYSEQHRDLTWPTQQMLGSIFWVKTLNSLKARKKLRWSFLFFLFFRRDIQHFAHTQRFVNCILRSLEYARVWGCWASQRTGDTSPRVDFFP